MLGGVTEATVNLLFVVLASGFLALIEPAEAVPPPPEQSAANCDTPTYASDHLVCADRGLLTLDRKIVELLAAAGRTAPPMHGLVGFEPQVRWFQRRSRCAFSERHAACLKAAYGDRIDVLTALAGAAPGHRSGSFGAVCPGAPWGERAVRLHASQRGALTVKDGRGQLLLVASAFRPADDWTPYVRFRLEANTVLVEPSEGPVFRCQALSAPSAPTPEAEH